MAYAEPELSYLILDFNKEEEVRRCLASVHEHTKIPYKIIYLHNGPADYPKALLDEGLIDVLIQPRQNTGLGIGTRDLFAACFSPWSFYLQNDQYLVEDITKEQFENMKSIVGKQYLSPHDGTPWTAVSVDLAGAVCGLNIYSERGHLIPTEFYKKMEASGILSFGGAGPWHEHPWREGQIQAFYKKNKYMHYTYESGPFVKSNGHRAVRENPDGSVWEQKVDTLEVRLLSGPVKEKFSYPRLSDEEWEEVLKTQTWPEWQIPAQERPLL